MCPFSYLRHINPKLRTTGIDLIVLIKIHLVRNGSGPDDSWPPENCRSPESSFEGCLFTAQERSVASSFDINFKYCIIITTTIFLLIKNVMKIRKVTFLYNIHRCDRQTKFIEILSQKWLLYYIIMIMHQYWLSHRLCHNQVWLVPNWQSEQSVKTDITGNYCWICP